VIKDLNPDGVAAGDPSERPRVDLNSQLPYRWRPLVLRRPAVFRPASLSELEAASRTRSSCGLAPRSPSGFISHSARRRIGRQHLRSSGGSRGSPDCHCTGSRVIREAQAGLAETPPAGDHVVRRELPAGGSLRPASPVTGRGQNPEPLLRPHSRSVSGGQAKMARMIQNRLRQTRFCSFPIAPVCCSPAVGPPAPPSTTSVSAGGSSTPASEPPALRRATYPTTSSSSATRTPQRVLTGLPQGWARKGSANGHHVLRQGQQRPGADHQGLVTDVSSVTAELKRRPPNDPTLAAGTAAAGAASRAARDPRRLPRPGATGSGNRQEADHDGRPIRPR